MLVVYFLNIALKAKHVVPSTSRNLASEASDLISRLHTSSSQLMLFSFPPVCPDKELGLHLWMPGHSEDHRVTIGYGQKILLTTSATVHSIEILNGGMPTKSTFFSLYITKAFWSLNIVSVNLIVQNQGVKTG